VASPERRPPFNGYLHGSFFPTSNRKAIDAGVALNRLLLDEATALAAATVRWLTGENCTAALGPVAAARAAVDFLVWSEVPSLGSSEDEAHTQNQRLDLPAALANRIGQGVGGDFFAARLPADRSSFLTKLGGVALYFASNLAFNLNGTDMSPKGERRAYLFRRADGTPLVVAPHDGAVTWAIIEGHGTLAEGFGIVAAEVGQMVTQIGSAKALWQQAEEDQGMP
jgi:hypothetical protein